MNNSGGTTAVGGMNNSGGTTAVGGMNNSGGTNTTHSSDGVKALSLGKWNSCALLESGKVKCWGIDDHGQVGTLALRPETAQCFTVVGTTMTTVLCNAPVEIEGISGAVAVATGGSHVCALMGTMPNGTVVGGNVKCWGRNDNGQLGNGTTTDSATPVAVKLGSALVTPTAIAAGRYHTCALLSDRTVSCWGNDNWDQLGAWDINAGCVYRESDNTGYCRSPLEVEGLRNVAALSLGYGHSCALLQNKTVSCWGDNFSGELGTGTSGFTTPTPASVGLSGVTALASAHLHNCVITGGTVKCWGGNIWGEIGDGSFDERDAPVTVSRLSGVVGIAAGDGHSCAVLGDNSMACWGDNQFGELGVPNAPSDFSLPTAVGGAAPLTGVTSIAAGGGHTCAILSDKSIRCWGKNSEGQLGNGALADSDTPGAVLGL
jgi:alpha-tubulin suppressor-like RCC1 family protein